MTLEQYRPVINKDFVIRYQYDHDNKTSLIGSGRYVFLLEKARDSEAMAISHFERAMRYTANKKESK